MATIASELMTAEEFAAWADRPENAGRHCELVRGRIVDMPPPQKPHGTLCSWIAYLLWVLAIERGRGRVESNDSGLVVEEDPDTVRGVDVMFFDEVVPFEEIPQEYNREEPVLAVEVWSPSDRPNAMMHRVSQYLAKGVGIVWTVDPIDRTVSVHRAGKAPLLLAIDDELTGFEFLPELKIRVSELFTLPGTKRKATEQSAG